MELQTIFNKVCMHLIKQGEAAVVSPTSCVYRGDFGKSCAVGCLIPDKYYHDGLEGQVADDKEVVDVLILSGILEPTDAVKLSLLGECQGAHDHELLEDGVYQWAVVMEKLAREYGLIVPKDVRALANG